MFAYTSQQRHLQTQTSAANDPARTTVQLHLAQIKQAQAQQNQQLKTVTESLLQMNTKNNTFIKSILDRQNVSKRNSPKFPYS
jgi:hypothetical protein